MSHKTVDCLREVTTGSLQYDVTPTNPLNYVAEQNILLKKLCS